MRARDRPETKADLKAKLRQWMRVTHLFAERRESRLRVHAEQYRSLHRDLLHTVSAAASADPRQETVYRELRETLTPWVNVESLTMADRDILFGVLDECEAVRRSLRGGLTITSRWVWTALILIAAGFAIGVLLALWEPAAGGNALSDVGLSVRNWARRAFETLTGGSAHRQLLAGGAAAVVVTMLIVWYSARKY
jgi:hypothetical protein